jgi:class 3 adenylate cyclase
VANVVRELCLGKRFEFESVGTVELKGFAEPVALYEVAWNPMPPQR